jgi:hypothetical protein
MHTGLLCKLFGKDKKWHGPCVAVLDADATIQTSGTDSIVNAGMKTYAPRLISGRLPADAVCFLPEESALVLIQVTRIRQSAGEDQIKQTYFVVDPEHIAAFEFAESSPVKSLGLTEPPGTVSNPLKARN